MAKKDKAVEPSRAEGGAPALLDFESRFEAGDVAAARRLARAALAGQPAADVTARAQAVLAKAGADLPSVGVFAAMLVVLLIVFALFILQRNEGLANVPQVDLNKTTVPAAPPGATP
ncbi:MAG: hypothetical protein HY904_13625 [Deltaproteobacteria bacterium]|nr:hypothetical protein [Deltaproteobacteria bacterium]